MLPRVRPLSSLQRKQQLRKVWSFEAARLRAKAEPATPDPIDDEPATVAVPVESMKALVFGRAA